MNPLARRVLAAIAVVCMAGCSGRAPVPPPRPKIRIAVAAQNSMAHLPTYLAAQLGYFSEEGLEVTLDEFPGGSKGLEALLGGSVDVVSGFYEQTILMAAEGKPLRSFVLLARSLMIAAAVSPATDKKISRIEDLKDARVGVTTLGAPTHQFIDYLLVQRGMSPSDITPIAIGTSASAVAAMERGVVDAGVVSDFTVNSLTSRHKNLMILADTRTSAGVRKVYGVDAYPGSAILAKTDWLDAHAGEARRIATAIKRALMFIGQHTPEDVMKAMPESHRGGDPAAYLTAIRTAMEVLSIDGVMDPSGPPIALKVLSISNRKVRGAKVDLAKTYTNEFVSEL